MPKLGTFIKVYLWNFCGSFLIGLFIYDFRYSEKWKSVWEELTSNLVATCYVS